MRGSDLGDLRLYSGQQEVPYALMVERGSRESDTRDVSVLQQSVIGGKTQFLIDMTGVAEYDHIDLKLTAKNFVAHARVEGQEDLHGTQWALLADPSSTIYQKKIWAATACCGCRFQHTNICGSRLMGR